MRSCVIMVSIGEAREIYNVEADTEEETRAKFARGEDLSGPFLTEVSDAEIIDIEEVK